jgi:hypothetical protein
VVALVGALADSFVAGVIGSPLEFNINIGLSTPSTTPALSPSLPLFFSPVPSVQRIAASSITPVSSQEAVWQTFIMLV